MVIVHCNQNLNKDCCFSVHLNSLSRTINASLVLSAIEMCVVLKLRNPFPIVGKLKDDIVILILYYNPVMMKCPLSTEEVAVKQHRVMNGGA